MRAFQRHRVRRMRNVERRHERRRARRQRRCCRMGGVSILSGIKQTNVNTNVFRHHSFAHSSLVYTEEALVDFNMPFENDGDHNTYHYDRCRQLCLTDPVHTIDLRNYMQSQVCTMQECVRLNFRRDVEPMFLDMFVRWTRYAGRSASNVTMGCCRR